jgi:RimJ/RimL family protein N-acetyltransferase
LCRVQSAWRRAGKLKNVYLKPIQNDDYEKIAKLISTDLILQKEFNFSKETIPSGKKVKLDFQNWCNSHSAKMFCIYKLDIFMGVVSLSRIDIDKHSARLGFWLGSKFRQKGYGSKAFKLILSMASNLEINQLNGCVQSSNIPSCRLWEKYGAKIVVEKDENFEYMLRL